jgi:hypothetical protein
MPDLPDTTDTSAAEPLAASERAALDELLRAQLGRRMTVCLLALTPTHGDDLAMLARRLAESDEIRVITPATSAEEGLLEAVRQDAEVVLIWLAADETSERATTALLLERADALGLRDRSVLAAIGPSMTRALAHHLLFEEGYAISMPTGQLLHSLAREAIARDELRRRGSSPPCYL